MLVLHFTGLSLDTGFTYTFLVKINTNLVYLFFYGESEIYIHLN